jgi:hypothetical protein
MIRARVRPRPSEWWDERKKLRAEVLARYREDRAAQQAKDLDMRAVFNMGRCDQ